MRRRKLDKLERWGVGIVILVFILNVALVGGVVYVVAHFVAKSW